MLVSMALVTIAAASFLLSRLEWRLSSQLPPKAAHLWKSHWTREGVRGGQGGGDRPPKILPDNSKIFRILSFLKIFTNVRPPRTKFLTPSLSIIYIFHTKCVS